MLCDGSPASEPMVKPGDCSSSLENDCGPCRLQGVKLAGQTFEFHKDAGLKAQPCQVGGDFNAGGTLKGSLNVSRAAAERSGIAGLTKTGAARTAPPVGAAEAAVGNIRINATAPVGVSKRVTLKADFEVSSRLPPSCRCGIFIQQFDAVREDPERIVGGSPSERPP